MARLHSVYCILLSLAYAGISSAQNATTQCRWAGQYDTSSILQDYTSFEIDYLGWEGKFVARDLGINPVTTLTYEGTGLDLYKGPANLSALHRNSAATEEALQIMLYAKAVNGSSQAALVLSPNNRSQAPQIAIDTMTLKLAQYQRFNATYPGYAGFITPYYQDPNGQLNSTVDWYNRIPATDNGINVWAIYAFVEALQLSGRNATLQAGWQTYLNGLKRTAVTAFYKANNASICAVARVYDAQLPPNHINQTYRCDSSATLNDPYEGELFTFWLDLFGNLSSTASEALWSAKRPQLIRTNYTLANNVTGTTITVRKGRYFNAREEWNLLELPYLAVDLVRRVFLNNQRARTCNSAALGIPGFFAPTYNSSNFTTAQVTGYISNAGIPSIANQTAQELDVITPYGGFPIMLFNKSVGHAWLHNVMQAKRMQNPYGTSDSIRVDGTGMSSFVSWDAKFTTVNAVMGGVSDLVASKMVRDGVYSRFITRLSNEYSLVFGSAPLSGENVPLCLPTATIPDTYLTDYTECPM